MFFTEEILYISSSKDWVPVAFLLKYFQDTFLWKITKILQSWALFIISAPLRHSGGDMCTVQPHCSVLDGGPAPFSTKQPFPGDAKTREKKWLVPWWRKMCKCMYFIAGKKKWILLYCTWENSRKPRGRGAPHRNRIGHTGPDPGQLSPVGKKQLFG